MPIPLAHRRLYDDPLIPCLATELSENCRPASRLIGPCRSHSLKFEAPLPIRLWHLASLDAPTVALVWSMAFAWSANVRLPWWVLVLLPLGVWAVYVVDRLLDARAGLRPSAVEQLRERHLFHWRFRILLAPMAVASAVAAAWIIFHLMPHSTRAHDSFLAAASLLYFTRVHSGGKFIPLFSKEMFVGVIFTFGCALPAFSRTRFSQPFLIATVLFALLAWLNCHAIDRWESHDANSSSRSIALPSLFLAAACFICSVLLAPSHTRSASLLACGAASVLLLAALDRLRSRMTPVTLRAAADLALLTPAMLLALAPLFSQ